MTPTRYVVTYADKVARFSDAADAREFALRASVYDHNHVITLSMVRGGALAHWTNGSALI